MDEAVGHRPSPIRQWEDIFIRRERETVRLSLVSSLRNTTKNQSNRLPFKAVKVYDVVPMINDAASFYSNGLLSRLKNLYHRKKIWQKLY